MRKKTRTLWIIATSWHCLNSARRSGCDAFASRSSSVAAGLQQQILAVRSSRYTVQKALHTINSDSHNAGSTVSAMPLLNMASRSSTAVPSPSNTQQRKIVDTSTLTLLEHVNLNVPSHEHILSFYYHLLGCGMDPRKAANLEPERTGKATLWANAGASQFHLPHSDVAQRIPGEIGLRYTDLTALQRRLEQYRSCYQSATVVDEYKIKLIDHYGNIFTCRQRAGDDAAASCSYSHTLQQPIIGPQDDDKWSSDVIHQYGRDATECQGIDYVEFRCPPGTASQIATFYEAVLDATTSVVPAPAAGDDNASQHRIAIIGFGQIDEDGRADQALLFRESDHSDNLATSYDGHHIALYVGQSGADFDQAFRNCDLANIVWINPRFSDKADTLEAAQHYQQFRFKNIVDMTTGATVLELEHEVRSVDHEAWPGAHT